MTWTRVAIIALIALPGCGDTTPAWELDHDRIIAVRATPPHVSAGERSTLDVLVTAPGIGPAVIPPYAAQAVPAALDQPVPPELAAAVVIEDGHWVVVAPNAAGLAAARATLGLAPTDSIPLRVGVAVDLGTGPMTAVKTITLGDARDNPALGAVTIAGAPIANGTAVPAGAEVALAVASVQTDHVDWLTSVGELSDPDDPAAVLVPDPATPAGHLAVVVRDAAGGVAWGYWSITVAP